MNFDYSELRKLIKKVYRTESAFADALHIARCTLCYKLNGERGFTAQDIIDCCSLLGIRKDEIGRYFYTLVGEAENNWLKTAA